MRNHGSIAVFCAIALAGCGQGHSGSGTLGSAPKAPLGLINPAAVSPEAFPPPMEGNPIRVARVDREIQYILACQVMDTRSAAYGAINDVSGAPTWIVPGEMAVAALVLWKAGHRREALLAVDYLARIQNPDGSWYNRYSGNLPTDMGRHARHAAQCAITFAVIGGYDWVVSRATSYLGRLADQTVKTGVDDGLVCGGFDEKNKVISDRWTSDNAYGAIAFDLAARPWVRDRIVAGINDRLRTGEAWASHCDRDGRQQADAFGWIHFAPAQMGLGRYGVVYPDGLADTISRRLQTTAGAVLESEGSKRLMPGIGFQASIAWREVGGQGPGHALSHLAWAEGRSGLLSPSGGWIDWREGTAPVAPSWQRFIDTSAYYVMVAKGWTFTDLLR